MTSPDLIPTTLPDQLRHLGLVYTADALNDLVARATQKRWSPIVLLEQLVKAELDAQARQRVERRLKNARLRPLQAAGRLRVGLAQTDSSAHGRPRLHARLPGQRRERHPCRAARPREDPVREESRPSGDPG